MEDCIFCKIVNKEIPAFKVYEDNDFLAFLDINPLNPGHTQLIPKKHFRWTWEVPNYGKYLEVARKIGLAAIKALDAHSFSIVTLGYGVPHAHIWVLPRFENDGHGGFIDWNSVKQISEEDIKKIAEEIRKNIE